MSSKDKVILTNLNFFQRFIIFSVTNVPLVWYSNSILLVIPNFVSLFKNFKCYGKKDFFHFQ